MPFTSGSKLIGEEMAAAPKTLRPPLEVVKPEGDGVTPARTIPGRELEAQFPHRARVRYLTLPGPDEPAAEGVGTVVGVVETIEDTGNGETGPCVTIDLALLVLPDDEPTALYVCPSDD